MIELRPYRSLGGGRFGWLETRHHFSFADYRDADRMHWGRLRVWNDDTVAPGTGFDPHPHQDMEIITYVRDGAITHEDSLGNVGRTAAGDVQVMSAGTGIRHAEYNREAVPTRLFQIWIIPDEKGGAPRWGTKPFPKTGRAGRFAVLASGIAGDAAEGDEGSDGALPIRAAARVLGATLQQGQDAEYRPAGRHTYLVPAAGAVTVNGVAVAAGDGLAIAGESILRVRAAEAAELVLVDTA